MSNEVPEPASEVSNSEETWNKQVLIEDLDKLRFCFSVKDPDAALRVSELQKAIRTDRLHDWGGVNLHAIFDLDGISERLMRQDPLLNVVLGIAEWIRNFMVLFPVLFTWWALAAASKQYEHFLGLATEQERAMPFLALWEQGFGGSWAPKFSTVALIDVLIIGIIVVLTIVIHVFRDVLEPRTKERVQSTVHRLNDVLWKVSLLIAEHANRQTAEGSLRESLAVYKTQTDEMLAMIATGEEQLKGLLNHRRTMSRLDALGTSVKKLEGSVTQARQIFGTLEADLRALVHLADHLDDQHAELQGFIQRTEERWHQFAASAQAGMNQSLNTLTKEVGQALASSTEAAHSTVQATNQLTDIISRFVEGLSGLDQSLHQATSRNAALSGEIQKASGELSQAAQQFSQDLQSSRQATQATVEAARQVTRLMTGLMQGQAQLRQSLDQASSTNATLAEQIQTASRGLARASQDLGQTQAYTATSLQDAIEQLAQLTQRMENLEAAVRRSSQPSLFTRLFGRDSSS